MLIEILQRLRECCFAVLPLCLAVPSTAQTTVEKVQRTLDPLQGMSWRDFQEVKQNFKDSPIAAAEKGKIESALKEPLDLGILDGLSEDSEDQSNRHTAGSKGQSRRLLDRSEILFVGVVPNNDHLYAVRIRSASCENVPNCQMAVVETSPSESRFLGFSGGWGVAVRRMPGEQYPMLVFASHSRAGLSGLEVLRFVKGKYVTIRCGEVTDDNDGISTFVFGKCNK